MNELFVTATQKIVVLNKSWKDKMITVRSIMKLDIFVDFLKGNTFDLRYY